MVPYFRDRKDAGRVLAQRLAHYTPNPNLTVLALPRGGVPVAFEVAQALHAPLDVYVVRKLGVPGHEELALGAVAGDGTVVINRATMLAYGVTAAQVRSVLDDETREIARRERAYRGGSKPIEVEGRTLILVDDGIATGSTMQAAIEALRQHHPRAIVVATPVASFDACENLRRLADDVICVHTPVHFMAVGASYANFTQTTDEEVRELLARAAQGPFISADTGSVQNVARGRS